MTNEGRLKPHRGLGPHHEHPSVLLYPRAKTFPLPVLLLRLLRRPLVMHDRFSGGSAGEQAQASRTRPAASQGNLRKLKTAGCHIPHFNAGGLNVSAHKAIALAFSRVGPSANISRLDSCILDHLYRATFMLCSSVMGRNVESTSQTSVGAKETKCLLLGTSNRPLGYQGVRLSSGRYRRTEC